MTSTRRRFLTRCAEIIAVGGTGLLAACQSQPTPIVVTSAPAASQPTPAPAAGASPGASPGAAASPAPSPAAVGASPAAKPAVSGSPSPSPAVAAGASPSPVAAGGGVGKPMYQMDPVHSGRSPYTGPRSFSVSRTFDTAQPSLRPDDPWNPSTDIQSSTAIGPDGTIYATNFTGWVFALKDSPSSANSLDLAWRFRPPNGSPCHCTPAVGRDGTVYVMFRTGTGDAGRVLLFALRAPSSGEDGEVVWQADLGAPGIGAPAAGSPTIGTDGTLYVTTPAGIVSAIDPANGNVKWSAETGNGQQAQFGQTVKVAPAIGSDGTVYTTTLTEGLVAVSPPSGSGNQGSVKWKFNFSEHLGPTPLVTAPVTAPPNRGQDGVGSGASATVGPDGTIYVGANNSNMYAVDPSGQQKWLFEADRELAGIWTTPALSADGSTIYFGANKGGMYAVNTRDGSKKWQFDIVGSIYSSPALDAAGTLFTASTVGHVFSLAADTGERYTDLDFGIPIWTAPSVRPDGTLVVGDRNGRIIVLSA